MILDVCVIDDQPDASVEVLRSIGARAHVFSRASSALAILDAVVFDAIVLDLSLPDVTDPRAFAAAVRALYPGRIVVASGLDPREVHQIADAIGAHPLPKPHLAAALVAAVTGAP